MSQHPAEQHALYHLDVAQVDPKTEIFGSIDDLYDFVEQALHGISATYSVTWVPGIRRLSAITQESPPTPRECEHYKLTKRTWAAHLGYSGTYDTALPLNWLSNAVRILEDRYVTCRPDEDEAWASRLHNTLTDQLASGVIWVSEPGSLVEQPVPLTQVAAGLLAELAEWTRVCERRDQGT